MKKRKDPKARIGFAFAKLRGPSFGRTNSLFLLI